MITMHSKQTTQRVSIIVQILARKCSRDSSYLHHSRRVLLPQWAALCNLKTFTNQLMVESRVKLPHSVTFNRKHLRQLKLQISLFLLESVWATISQAITWDQASSRTSSFRLRLKKTKDTMVSKGDLSHQIWCRPCLSNFKIITTVLGTIVNRLEVSTFHRMVRSSKLLQERLVAKVTPPTSSSLPRY